MNNQRLLKANRTKSHAVSPGAPRNGRALLAGLLRCGKCGHKLHVQYRGTDGRAPRYTCMYGTREQGKPVCLLLGGGRLDEAVAREVINACQPLAVKAAMQAFEEDENISAQKRRALELTLKQARYEAERSRRQYELADPEHRLVCAELEKRWNEAMLREKEAVQRLKDESEISSALTEEQKQRLLTLGADLEETWHAAQAQVDIKKRIIRSVIKEIIVNTDDANQAIELKIHWMGGVHTRCSVKKNKSGHNNRVTDKNVVEIVRVYAQAWSDRYIASLLNRLGLSTGTGNSWNEDRVKNLRLYNKIPVFSKSTERTWLTMSEAAEQLHVSVCVVKTMISHKMIAATQVTKGAPWLIQRDTLCAPSVRNYLNARHMGKARPQEDQRQSIIPY